MSNNNASGYKGRFFTEAVPLLYVPFAIPEALLESGGKGVNSAELLGECLAAAALSSGFTNKNQKPTEHIVRTLNKRNNIDGMPTGLIGIRVDSDEKLGKRGMHQRLEAVDAKLIDPARICDVYMPASVAVPEQWGKVENYNTPLMSFKRVELRKEVLSKLIVQQASIVPAMDVPTTGPVARTA